MLLAIDSSTEVSGVAVLHEGRVAAEVLMQARLTHSRTLVPHIREALSMAAVEREELKAVAVSIGPGSFTGLRIGLATAKAMAYALDIPLAGVGSLEALAWHFPVEGLTLVPMMDAQKGNAYVERYAWAGEELRRESPMAVLPVAEILRRAGEIEGPVVLLGDVPAKRIEGRLPLPGNVRIAPTHLRMPRAANVALAGSRMLREGRAGSPMDMEPVYVRRSEAEDLWEKRHGKDG